MTSEHVIVHFLVTSLVAGVLGAIAMEIAMWLMCRTGWAQGNMIVAVGSLFSGVRETALRTGIIVHGISAIVFAMIYNLAMMEFGLDRFPRAFAVGAGFGVLHGMIVALMLVWVVSDNHPLEEFKKASFAVGLSHFVGHIAYGAVVGLVIAIASR